MTRLPFLLLVLSLAGAAFGTGRCSSDPEVEFNIATKSSIMAAAVAEAPDAPTIAAKPEAAISTPRSPPTTRSATTAASNSAPPPAAEASPCAGDPAALTVTAFDVETKSEANKGAPDGLSSADYYFDSYAHFGIHEEMIKDDVRTLSYKRSIAFNPRLFRNKVVLDVGCGTGIISMFAAQAGAKLVIGVDSSSIIEKAQEIIKANNFSHVITLIKGKMEDVVLPVEKVDVIISEWMGYMLFYESMLPTVIFARDKYLQKGGLVLPDKARLVISAIQDAETVAERIDWWKSVYGFNMSVIRNIVINEPLVETVLPQMVASNFFTLMHVDIDKISVNDLVCTLPFKLVMQRDDLVHALVLHFDIDFTPGTKPVSFSTGPQAKPTHWRQTIFYLESTLEVSKGDQITGHISIKPTEKNPRDLNIIITHQLDGKKPVPLQVQHYTLR